MALHEVYRFENRLIEKTVTFAGIWNGLVQNVIEGLETPPRCEAIPAHNGRY